MIANEPADEEKRLIAIAISPETAERMAADGWTVEKVLLSDYQSLHQYNSDDDITLIWKENAIRFLKKEND